MEIENGLRNGEIMSANYSVGDIALKALFSRSGVLRLFLLKPPPPNPVQIGNQVRVSISVNQPDDYQEEFRSYVMDVACYLEMLFNQIQPNIMPAVDLSGFSENRRRVLIKTSEIPFGETRSYSWVAEESGFPKGCRIVGRFLKENPLPLIIPCHRVVKADGKVGGYCFGEVFKKNLIEIERIAKNSRNSHGILVAN